MYAKKWIILFFTVIIIICGTIQLFLTFKNIPLRFSNSISYDAKLDFIYKNHLLKDADTLVIGSSMALNNINGITLEEESKKIHKVVNLASWGLETSQTLKQLELIDLNSIKYIIYSTEYGDFSRKFGKDIDYQSVKNILQDHFTFKPYIKRFSTAVQNFKNYLYYDEIYHNPHSYESLLFDRTGSANLDFTKKDISKERWDSIKEFKNKILPSSINALIDMARLCRDNNIQFIVATSPIHIPALKRHPEIKQKIDQFIQKLKNLSQKEHFTYIDAHNILLCEGLCFVDTDHLNKKATVVYSNLILQESGLK